ncbi:MAG: chemotaxis protein CheX [Clostridia bacterium]|nr:chemotaxis protein CheX [Clostridia bacterium]
MFTQFFGSYLLNKKLVTPEQLKDALDYQKNVHLKLGVMAVNSGYMSAADVSAVHGMQAKVDKKFGELAIEMGFLDEEKLKVLLSTQKSGHLLLGQAMVDKGYMTLEKFSEALDDYKKDYSLTNEQFNSLQNEDIDEIVNTFYSFDNSDESKVYKGYFALLIRNIIRFIDADFRPLNPISVNEYKFDWMAAQEIKGEASLYTCIAADQKTFIAFAGRYADEAYTENDEYVQAAVGEFLNLINGLFLVNMSNDDIELELEPQYVSSGKNLTKLTEAFCIPVEFSFGRIDFIISKSIPVIL